MRRRVLQIALGVVALAVVLAAVALILLFTPFGQERARRFALGRANEAIRGTVELGRLEVAPSGWIRLTGLRLRGPSGEVVVSAEQIAVKIDPSALLEHRIWLSRVNLARPEVHLVTRPGGSNLADAVAPRHPSPPSPPRPQPAGKPWSIEVDALSLQGGLVDSRTGPDDPHALHLEAIEVDGKGRDQPRRLEASLTGSARMTEPEATSFSLALDAEGTGLTLNDRLEVKQLHLEAGASRLDASGQVRDGQAQAAASIALDRALGQSLGIPLTSDLVAQGEAHWTGQTGTVDLRFPDARGSAHLVAEVNPSVRPLAYKAQLSLDALDPAASIAGAPEGTLSGTISLDGHGIAPGEIEGTATVRLLPSRLAGVGVDKLFLAGHVAREVLTVEDLALELPGARLRGTGTASAAREDLTLTAEVTSLAELTRNLGVKGWSGAGTAQLRLTGSARRPRLDLTASAPEVRGQQLRLDALQAQVSVPDLRRPLILSARLRSGRGAFQQWSVNGLTADVDLDGRHFQGAFTTTGNAAVRVEAAGDLPDRHGVMAVQALNLELGNIRWTLARPIHLDLSNGVRVDRARLVSGEQAIEIEGGLRGQGLDARLTLARIDLARLPRLFVPERLKLAGWVDGQLSARGAVRDPTVQARLHGLGLAVFDVSGMSADVTAELTHHRARAEVAAAVGDAQVALHADTPIALASEPASTPVSGTMAIANIDLETLSRLVDRPGLARGRADVALDFSGTLARPTGTLVVRTREAAIKSSPAISGQASLDFGPEARLRLDLSANGTSVRGTAALPLPDDPIRHPERLRGLLDAPLTASGEVEHLDLARWAGQHGVPEAASGTLDLSLTATGAARRPVGRAHLEAQNVRSGGLALSGGLDLQADSDRLALQSDLSLRARPALRLRAVAGTSLGELIAHPERLGATAVDVDLKGGPLDLTDLQREPAGAVHGQVKLSARLTGTPDDPELHARMTVGGTRVEQAQLGGALFTADYQSGRLAARGQLSSGPPGTLSLDATAQQDLGLASWRRGIDIAAVPFSAHLAAQRFDLSSLAGITESVRTLAGTFDADIAVSGTAAQPSIRGSAEIEGGRVVLVGLGDYRDIALEVSADDRGLRLTRLEVHASGGVARLSGAALRADPSAPFQITGTFGSEAFPVMFNDQLLAYVESHATIDGESFGKTSLIKLHLSQVHAQVPSLTHKDVQSLEPNPDIVVLGERRPHPATPVVASRAPTASQAPGPPAPYTGRTYLFGIYAPSNFWVRGQDINVDLRAFVGARLRDALEIVPPPGMNQPSTIEVIRGRLEVIGRKLEIPTAHPARLTFQGGDPKNAALDVVALYRDARDGIVVTVSVTGPLAHPNPPSLSSDPPMDPSRLALLLATGHLDAKRGSGAASGAQAASIAGAILAAQVQKTLATRLPLDTVSVESAGANRYRLEVGRYITDKVYVGYTHNINQTRDQNGNEFAIQYQLSTRWELQAVGGDAGIGGADVLWSKDY